jgi:hypothetical protein
MRSRILLSVVLAAAMAMLTGCGTRSINPSTGDQPATGAPSRPPAGPTSHQGGSSTHWHPSAPPPATSTTRPMGSPSHSGTTLTTRPISHPPTTPVRFGKTTTGGPNFDVVVSPDRTTLTTRFAAFEVGVGHTSTRPEATPRFSLALPLTGSAPNAKLTFYVSGYASVFTGATARLTVSANGRVTVKDFPKGWDNEFVRTLTVPAIPASTCRLTIVLQAQQIFGSSQEPTAYLNVSAIDAKIT